MPMGPSSSSSFFSFTITYFLILVSLTPLTPILSEQSQALFFCEQVKSDKVSLKEDIHRPMRTGMQPWSS